MDSLRVLKDYDKKHICYIVTFTLFNDTSKQICVCSIYSQLTCPVITAPQLPGEVFAIQKLPLDKEMLGVWVSLLALAGSAARSRDGQPGAAGGEAEGDGGK